MKENETLRNKNNEIENRSAFWTVEDLLYTAIDCDAELKLSQKERDRLPAELANGALVFFARDEIEEALKLELIDLEQSEKSFSITDGLGVVIISRTNNKLWSLEKYEALRRFQLSDSRNLVIGNMNDYRAARKRTDDFYWGEAYDTIFWTDREYRITWQEMRKVKKSMKETAEREKWLEKRIQEREDPDPRSGKDMW